MNLFPVNLTWYTEEADFSKCFHSTVLIYLPCGYLWLFLPFYYLFKDKRPYANWGGWAKITIARYTTGHYKT